MGNWWKSQLSICIKNSVTVCCYLYKCYDLSFVQPRRYGVDEWDRSMMERDKRLTGSAYRQKVS